MNVPDYLHEHIQQLIGIQTDEAIRRAQWAVVFGLKPFKRDGVWWVYLDAQDNNTVSASGDTPQQAIFNFDSAMCCKEGQV